MTINSREKGKRGERDFAEYLRSKGIQARRGVQYRGGSGSPDVVTGLPGTHFEVKFTERAAIYDWLDQAVTDAGSSLPIVAHRRKNKTWVAIMRMDDVICLLQKLGYGSEDGVGAIGNQPNLDYAIRRCSGARPSSPPVPRPLKVPSQADLFSDSDPEPETDKD